MAVNPLTTPPIPPNSNLGRGMFAWVTSNSTQDPLSTDAKQQTLINFCGAQGVNYLFLDIWQYLGAANWTTSKLNKLRQFIDVAHRSGIKVWALAGNTDWGTAQNWVATNILKNLLWFQNGTADGSKNFDGVMLDVEYWTDGGLDVEDNCSGLCDLMRMFRITLNVPVGCFTAFYLKDNTNTRTAFTYQGKSAQDGEHLMDNSDLTVVGAYRDHAADNMTDGAGQITLFTPWYDYASQYGKNIPLMCGSETIDVSPAYITYYSASKAAMETEHTAISNVFRVATNSCFVGQAVHSYDGWKVMS
jgi:hypothetical protein